MKHIFIFFAYAAMVIVFSACGGNGNGSGGGYKGDFAFFEAPRESQWTTQEEFTYDSSGETSSAYFKKQETPAQKEALDKMMAGGNKKIAVVTGKILYANNRVYLSFYCCSIDNGWEIPVHKGSKISKVLLEVSLEEFPDAGKPFDKYYVGSADLLSTHY